MRISYGMMSVSSIGNTAVSQQKPKQQNEATQTEICANISTYVTQINKNLDKNNVAD